MAPPRHHGGLLLLGALGACAGGADAGCEVSGIPRCYKDSPAHSRDRNSKTMMGAPIVNIGHVANRHSWPLTREYCAQLCHDLNKTLAGIEGVDCYCSDGVAKGSQELTGRNACNAPCTACPNTQRCNTTANGNRTETGGGGGEVLVYSFACKGAPTPRPYPSPPPPPCQGNGDRHCGELYNPCINTSKAAGGYYKLPFCNHSLPTPVRVQDAIGRMTLKEKVSLEQFSAN
jgi:hypothetical protein